MIAFAGSGRVSGASWSPSEVSGAGPECSGGVSDGSGGVSEVSDAMSDGSDGVSEASEAMSDGSSGVSGVSDAMSNLSGGVSEVSDAMSGGSGGVSGVSDAVSEVSDAASDCLHNCRVRGCWRGDPWVSLGGSSSSGPARYPARCRITHSSTDLKAKAVSNARVADMRLPEPDPTRRVALLHERFSGFAAHWSLAPEVSLRAEEVDQFLSRCEGRS